MFLTGQLLVSMPDIEDIRFNKTVLFMCGHDKQGAMGLILNKPLANVSVKNLLEELNIKYRKDIQNLPVYWGGPVESGRGFVLHSNDVILESSIKINDNFYLSASLEILDSIAIGEGPKHKMIFLGYSAWASNQLDGELKINTWLHYSATQQIVFNASTPIMWDQMFKTMNIDPSCIVSSIGHA